jgi:hypothetical protein
MNVMEETMSLIETYEAAGRESRALLHAARAGDWTEFDAIQERCLEIVKQLRRHGSRPQLPPRQAARRHEILTAILADDRSIRDILEPASRQFDALMSMRAEPGTRLD